MIIPHWYQIEAKNAIFDYYFTHGKKGNPLICMPTASGKSIVITDFLMDVFKYFPNQRVMMLTHVWKLIAQNADKMRTMWPTAPLGIHSAGLDSKDTMLPITYGGVKSVFNTLEKNKRAFGSVDLLLIDEAHLIGSDENSAYLKVIKMLTEINPFLRIIGFTATWWRSKMGVLTEGDIFSDIAYNICDRESFQRLIGEGHLCTLIGKPTDTKIEGLLNVKMTAGEYNQKEADELIDKEEIIYASCKEVLEYGHDREKLMGFASGVKSCEHIAEMLDSLGAKVTCVHSKLSQKENEKRLRAFSNGEYWGVIGANMLTTGYDEPQIDLIADWQLTASSNKHVQKLGRGTRVLRDWKKWRSTPKLNTLVLDFVDNIGRLGPIDDPVMPRKPGQKTGEPPPVKICEAAKLKINEGKTQNDTWVAGCGAYNHASVRNCCNCSEEFSFKVHIESTAYVNSPMSVVTVVEPKIERIEVSRPVFYSKHEGRDKGAGITSPPTVKAIYPFGMRSINMFLCFEHTGKARRIAHEWWQRHSALPPPESVDEFLSRTHELRIPKAMLVHVNLKYPEIKSLEF